MSGYATKSGREPDFRVAYRRLPARQKLFQHMRSNVHWEYDNDAHRQWSIWPEFETPDQQYLAEGNEPWENGTATMWVLIDQPEYRAELRHWLQVGRQGFFMAGSEKIAHFTILELLGIEAKVNSINPE